MLHTVPPVVAHLLMSFLLQTEPIDKGHLCPHNATLQWTCHFI